MDIALISEKRYITKLSHPHLTHKLFALCGERERHLERERERRTIIMATESSDSPYDKAKPFLAVVLMQFGYAGMSIISKHALNEGMSQHVLVVYRHAVATIVIAPFAFIFDRYGVSVGPFYHKYTPVLSDSLIDIKNYHFLTKKIYDIIN